MSLFYNPCDPHQAGTAVWLVNRYKKEDPECRLPKWKQWLFLRNKWMRGQEAVFGKGNLTCSICGRSNLYAFTKTKSQLATVDHILPVSKFPRLWNVTTNFQIACYKCNQEKADEYVA